MDSFAIIFSFTILELHHAWSHLISLRLWFFLSGQCWSYLMFWFNSIILKMPRRAYLMIFPGIKGMGITNLHWCASSLFIQCVRRLSVSLTVNHALWVAYYPCQMTINPTLWKSVITLIDCCSTAVMLPFFSEWHIFVTQVSEPAIEKSRQFRVSLFRICLIQCRCQLPTFSSLFELVAVVSCAGLSHKSAVSGKTLIQLGRNWMICRHGLPTLPLSMHHNR